MSRIYIGTTGPEMWQPSGTCENGCLLTVAITVMLFQNGTVGTTGPEMWQPGDACGTVVCLCLPSQS